MEGGRRERKEEGREEEKWEVREGEKSKSLCVYHYITPRVYNNKSI